MGAKQVGKVAPLVAVMVAMVNDGVGGDGDNGDGGNG